MNNDIFFGEETEVKPPNIAYLLCHGPVAAFIPQKFLLIILL